MLLQRLEAFRPSVVASSLSTAMRTASELLRAPNACRNWRTLRSSTMRFRRFSTVLATIISMCILCATLYTLSRRNQAATFQHGHELVGVHVRYLVHLRAGPADLDFVRLARLPQPEVLAQVALRDVTGAAQHLSDVPTSAGSEVNASADAGA